ncbi:hypothetical protein BCR25_00830 [Enterococcus termitis]|uniref:Uncharacterized protein n=1 Tax=Enterococcus termitis TaxID=332950 RepID=A0A1E5H757_9ENTE|nr:hypothetical protein BCR25_00830 [Enterococcus termitis]
MKIKYLVSLAIGLIMVFVLQTISYLNWLLVDQDVINGIRDQYLFLKTPLMIIPVLFISYFIYGLRSKKTKD